MEWVETFEAVEWGECILISRRKLIWGAMAERRILCTELYSPKIHRLML